MIWKIIKTARLSMDEKVQRTNVRFNNLTAPRKKTMVLSFGIIVSWISILLIIQALQPQENMSLVAPDHISVPHDIFMNNEASYPNSHLVPVGKLKGEVDGEFESFYLAVDQNGHMFMNRDLEYSEKAYEKSEQWKPITREELKAYEKELHFIPLRGKGVKR